MSKLIKKKRKRNLIISLIVLTVLLTLGGMTTALGSTSVGDNIGIAPPSYVYGWPTSQPCRKSCTYSTHWGLRLALVDKNGKRVSGTRILDLWGSAFLNASGTKHRNYITVVEGRDVNLSSAAYFGANLRQEALKTDQYGLQVTKGPYWTSSSTVKASFLEFAQYAQKSAPGLATALRTVDGSLGTGSGADITVTPKWFDYVADIAEAQDKNKETDDGPGNLLYEILVKLGYKGTGDGSRRVHDAAREGYFLQAEPLMTYARIGGQIRRMYWFTGTLTEAMMFDIAANGKVGGPCGGFWHGYCDGVPKTPGLYIVDGKDRPSCFIEGDNYFDNFSAWEMLGPITTGIRGEGVAHIYFGQFNDGVDCETAVKWIHAHPDQYGAPNSDTYNAAIAKIVDGTFTYIDNTGATSTEMTIDGKYPTSTYVFLNPTNYMQRVDDPPTSEKKASCEIPEKLICDQVVSYINKWSGLVKDTDEYHNAIDRVEAGTYFYYGSPGGDGINKHYYMIDGPYDRMYLKKEKYTDPDSPYDGYASCAEPGKLSCEQAVAIINGETPSGLTGFEFNSGVSFPLNSQAYHDAVAQVVAGNFKYTDGKNRAWEIDTGYSFNMLDPTYYVLSQFGGKAACEDIPVPCGEPAEVEIDKTCETGLNYYKDSAQEKYWLVCESAYLKGNDPLTGIPYSSDNTGHDAVEEANDGIVGNKDYCELFCTETVETEFPTSVSNVKAGQV